MIYVPGHWDQSDHHHHHHGEVHVVDHLLLLYSTDNHENHPAETTLVYDTPKIHNEKKNDQWPIQPNDSHH